MPTMSIYTDKDANCPDTGDSNSNPTGTIYRAAESDTLVLSVVSSGKDIASEGLLRHWPTTGIPTGATITAADFEFYMVSNANWAFGSSPSEVWANYRLASAFTESNGAAAPTRSSTGAWSAGNGNAGSGIWVYEKTGAGAFTDSHWLTLIQGWYAGTITNYGMWCSPNDSQSNEEGDETQTRGSREGGHGERINITFTVPTPTAPGAWTNPTTDVTRAQDGGTFTLNWGDGGANGGPAINDYRLEYAYKLNSGDAWGSWNDWTWAGSSTSQYNWSVGSGGSNGFYKFRVRTWNGYNYSAYGPESSAIQLIPDKTPIGKDLGLVWGTRTMVNDNADLRWAVRAALGDTSTLRWHTKAPLGDTISPRWNVRAALFDTINPRWGVRVAPAPFDTLTLRWNVRAALGDTSTLRWNTKAPAFDTLGLVWTTRAALGDTVNPQWGVRLAIPPFDTVTLRWHVRFALGDTINPRWGVRIALGDTINPRWAIRITAGDPIQLIWKTQRVLQRLAASSDILVTGWTKQDGGTTGLYTVIDEGPDPDLSDYITITVSAP